MRTAAPGVRDVSNAAQRERLQRLREALNRQLADPAKMREMAARIEGALFGLGWLNRYNVDDVTDAGCSSRGAAPPLLQLTPIGLATHDAEPVNDERDRTSPTLAPSLVPCSSRDGRGAAAALEPRETIGRRAASTCSASFVVGLRLDARARLYGMPGRWCCVEVRVRRLRPC